MVLLKKTMESGHTMNRTARGGREDQKDLGHVLNLVEVEDGEDVDERLVVRTGALHGVVQAIGPIVIRRSN